MNHYQSQQVLKNLENARQQGKKIIATNGCFDILHVGHLRYLTATKNLAKNTFLIIGLNADSSVKKLKGDTRPLNGELERRELLMGLKCVDEVLIFSEPTATEFLKLTQPDIYTKGGDYQLKGDNICEEFKYCCQQGIEIQLINFEDGYSSTKVIEKL
jgi:glycerol-3-phosphate cytidylyltransferase